MTSDSTSGRGSAVVLVAGLVVVVAYPMIPWAAVQDGVFVVLFGVAAALVARRARRDSVEPRVWGAWAVGLGLFAGGTLIHLVGRLRYGALPEIPNATDAFFVASFLALLVGFLIALPRGRDRDQVLDHITVAAATGGAVVVLLVPWAVARVTAAQWGLLALYPLLGLLLFVGVVRVALAAPRWTPALAGVVGATTLLVVAQSAYAVLSLTGDYDTGHIIDVGWHLAAVLWAATAAHPSARRGLVPLSPDPPNRLTRFRVAYLAYTILILPAVRLGQYAAGQITSMPLFALAVGGVGVLILVRVVAIARRLQDVSEEQRALFSEQQKLRLTYDLALRAASTHTWEWDVRDDTLRFSDHARILYGDPPSTMGEWLARVHPDDVPLARAAVDEGTVDAPMQAFEVRVRGREDEWRRVSVMGRGFFDDGRLHRAIGVGVDVTQVREAEQEGAHRRVLLEHVTKASPVILFRVAQPGAAVTFISENVERVLGHPVDTWRDRSRFEELLHPGDRHVRAQLGEDVGRHGHGEAELRVRHRDGGWRHVRLQLQRDEALFDGLPGVTGSALDVTEQREAEERLRHSQKLEAVGRVAGGVAHDFNNLLTAMLGYVELARSADDDEERAGHLAEVTRAGDRAASLVDQLLAFSRRRTSRSVAIDVNDAVGRVVQLAERIIADGAGVTADLQEDLPAVLADPAQLEQAVLNLILNSRDAVPPMGRIEISTAVTRIDDPDAQDPDVPAAGSYVEISVRDDGHGMRPEVRDRAVEPFFTTKPEGAGTGLGLSSAYGFAVQAGGALVIDSTEGVGTTVRIVLPPAGTAPAAAPAESRAAAPTGDATGCVLVVEDQAQIRALLVRALETRGYDVRVASDGAEALAMVGAGLQPGVVVSDIVMPGVDGVTLARQLRARDEGIGVLLISGYSQRRIGDATLDPGIRFLQKPFTLDRLIAEVASLHTSLR